LWVARLQWVIIEFLLVCGNLGVNLQADGAESDLSREEDDSLATHGVLLCRVTKLGSASPPHAVSLA
jgi:hypothetical protein